MSVALAVLLVGIACEWAGEKPRAAGWYEQRTGWIRALFIAAFLPHQAFVSLDAIGRVFYRRAVSRRSLLQWQTSRAAGAYFAGLLAARLGSRIVLEVKPGGFGLGLAPLEGARAPRR